MGYIPQDGSLSGSPKDSGQGKATLRTKWSNKTVPTLSPLSHAASSNDKTQLTVSDKNVRANQVFNGMPTLGGDSGFRGISDSPSLANDQMAPRTGQVATTSLHVLCMDGFRLSLFIFIFISL